MHVTQVLLATLGATVVYFVLGGLFFTSPVLRNEFLKYPAVYRSQQEIRKVWPIGIAGMVLSMLVLAILYSLIPHPLSPFWAGLHYGMLIGLYAVGSFVLHNHVNLNIGIKLTLQQAVAYFIEWLAVGIVIAEIIR